MGDKSWLTVLSVPYLSVPWMLMEAIFQIYVPQDHRTLNHESDATNEFLLTVILRPSSENHKFHRWSREIHAGRDRLFLFANLDQVTETSFASGMGV